jgi:adenylate cyclase
MEPAPELVEFAERWMTTWFVDFDNYVVPLSSHPGLRFIGPDPDEWWEGLQTHLTVGRAQFSEMATLDGIRADADEIVAWKEGTVGWIAIRCHLTFGDRDPQEARMTVIVHEEGVYWKIVHQQFGFTIPNEDAVGLELTTAVDELLLQVQDSAPPASSVSADGSVTIVFTDLEGSTTLMESLGEARWLQLLEWHDDTVRKKTAAFGGTVVKGQGDGFMLAFPAAGSATACASAVQRTLSEGWGGVPVSARVGLHTGNAKAEGGDFFGRTVVVAARICRIATGGEVLLSLTSQESLDGTFALSGPRTTALRGLSGVYTVFALNWR